MLKVVLLIALELSNDNPDLLDKAFTMLDSGNSWFVLKGVSLFKFDFVV